MNTSRSILIRPPVLDDATAVHQLIKECPPLDPNSLYCNLLQCSHFAKTSAIAESGDSVVGFISGYSIPQRPDSLFVWQVAVSEQARGFGLAAQMLAHILSRPECEGIHYLETTITPSNKSSWRLFRKVAEEHTAELRVSDWLDEEQHFNGQHESEELLRIGPFNSIRRVS